MPKLSGNAPMFDPAPAGKETAEERAKRKAADYKRRAAQGKLTASEKRARGLQARSEEDAFERDLHAGKLGDGGRGKREAAGTLTAEDKRKMAAYKKAKGDAGGPWFDPKAGR